MSRRGSTQLDEKRFSRRRRFRRFNILAREEEEEIENDETTIVNPNISGLYLFLSFFLSRQNLLFPIKSSNKAALCFIGGIGSFADSAFPLSTKLIELQTKRQEGENDNLRLLAHIFV